MATIRPFTALALVVLLIQSIQASSSFDTKNANQFVCDTSTARTAEALATAQHNRRQQRRNALSSLKEAITNDNGHIAVLEDDGTVIIQPNRLDLANRSITFTPVGAGRYSVVTQTGAFDDGSESRTVVPLGDDDSAPISLPFAFVFYGVSYTSVHLNSDGNLTFNEPDRASTDRNLRRIVAGPPRISPLFDDLYPLDPGRISVDKLPDRVLFTWTSVGEWAGGGSGSRGQNSFQAVLGSNGVIRFNYRSLDAAQAVVSIAPGRPANPETSLIDFTAQVAPSTQAGVIAEVFATTQEMDLAQVAEIFYQTHPDSYDGLIVFADFAITLNQAFAYALPIRNSISGIINTRPSGYDYGLQFGSPQRLSVVVNMGNLSRYPADPRTQFLGTNNSLQILGQEFGHRWLAFADIGTPSLLGRDESHWSFLYNTLGSVMEGNEIEDLGNGRFRTVGATVRYSPFDQYVMGLRPASEVPPSFVVNNPVLPAALPAGFPSACRDPQVLPGCPPFVGLQFSGARRDVTIDDFISVLGPRNPSADRAPKDFRAAFILVTQRGQGPQAFSLQKLEAFRTQWASFFTEAVDGRGTMNTGLLYFPPQITSISPLRGPLEGGTAITIAGSGFQPDSTVTIGGLPAPAVFRDSTMLVATAPRSETAGTASVVVRNPRDGQSAVAATAFRYIAPVTELRADITANGSRHIETAGAAAIPQVGYATLESALGVEVIRSYAGSEVRSEAAVPAATIGTSFRIYAERTERTSTGLALVNTASSAASMTAVLSNGLRTTLQLAARSQKSQYVHELFPEIGTSFTGSLSLVSDVPIGLAALRGTTNQAGDFIITTVPVSSGSTTSAIMVFPQIADGQGYVTEVILLNPASATISGSIQFSFNVSTDRGTSARFSYEIPAGEVWKLRTSGTPVAVQTGHATIVPASGNVAPVSTAILKQFTGTNLNFEAGASATATLTRGMMFGVRDGSHRSVVAMVGVGSVQLTAYRADGIGAASTKTVSLGPNGRVAAFIDELIPDLPSDFEGTVMIESGSPISVITLRTTVNTSGSFLMTAMPVVDLDRPSSSGTSYFPQLADGGGFITEFLLLNPAATNATMRFFSLDGQTLAVSLR